MCSGTRPEFSPGTTGAKRVVRKALLTASLAVMAAAAHAEGSATEFGGHFKARALGSRFPHDSLLRDLAGASARDVESELRLNLAWREDAWTLHADYQLLAFVGDGPELAQRLPDDGLLQPRYPNDDRRLLDLTHEIHEGSNDLWLQRLDRLWLGWTGERTVVRLGRQSLSWGNGSFYAPMDLVNPFDPAAVDTEYKFGDDMLYAQWLRDNGDDLQLAAVARRDPATGERSFDQGTLALKYHGFAGDWEVDLLAAAHYDQAVVAAGVTRGIGGALWRTDAVLNDTPSGSRLQLVTNLGTSWVWHARNVTGSLEYFYNEFGFREGPYDPGRLAGNPELVERLARGDLFTLGRHNLAASLLIEWTPLWTVSPTALVNLGDGSALVQLVARGSLAEEVVLLGSLHLPLGPGGTEFGGIDSGQEGKPLSTDASVFLQLARYF